MVDPVWAGVVGAVAGGVIGAATSLLSPLILWKTEKKRLAAEHENAKALADQKHKHEIIRLQEEARQSDREHKRALILQWRNGVREASEAYNAADQAAGVIPDVSVTGQMWFETLRPHLDEDKGDLMRILRHGDWIWSDAATLFEEIARIEREWELV
ncbi:hypothetical protein MYP14_08305 [Rhodococcus pyridinivorans]|uniref:hypothetical protein n=1 Tax=Rhodococcus pyridinivorans TaxID=103816 RepID=UPI001FFFB016|nr:hypothetical protein [Rhodococcus pyridinivorans]UPK65303.1 hypothetical protein MYP14_08305 [Rhodococcus pyridinivorans]